MEMTTTLRYRYRAYPDAEQDRALLWLFGCCRVAYNDALARAKYVAGRTYPGGVELQRRVFTLGK